MVCTYNEWPPVVLTVLVLVEDVNHGGHQGVEEGEDCNGDKELSGRREVSHQVQTLSPPPLTYWGLKRHLVQSDRNSRDLVHRNVAGHQIADYTRVIRMLGKRKCISVKLYS